MDSEASVVPAANSATPKLAGECNSDDESGTNQVVRHINVQQLREALLISSPKGE